MASNTNWLERDASAGPLIQGALERLDCAQHELLLDFSAVRRIDPAALLGMQQLAAKAQDKSVKVTLRGVNVEVYKVLKLVALATQFSFLT
jgi:anti-anti-sigma regulatory factor